MKRAFFIIILCLFAVSASAENVYVSTCGDSTSYNPATNLCTGGSDRSYDTVQEAINYVSAGDTIHIRAGTWTENLVMTGNAAKGTDWDTPITMQVYSGDAMPVIEGGVGRALINETGGNFYWVFDGLKFTRTYAAEPDSTNTIYIGNSSYYKFQNCTIEGQFKTYTGGHYIVDTCLFDGESQTWERSLSWQCQGSGTAYGECEVLDCTFQNYSQRGIWIYHTGDGNQVLRNTVVNCNTNIDIDNYGYGTQSDDNTVSYNKSYDGANIGFEFENCTNSIASYNLIYNCVRGISVIDYDAFRGSNSSNILLGNIVYDSTEGGIRITEAYGTKIYNNTVYNNTTETACIALKGSTYPCNNTDIRNNIMYQPAASDACLWFGSAPSGVTCDYNIFYNSAQTDVVYYEETSTWYTLAEWVAATAYDDNSIQDNPDFTTVGSDFTLTSVSPAIDTGVNLGATYDDALDPGSSWPDAVTTGDQDDYGERWEIGAYLLNPGTGIPGPGCAGTFILENAEIH